MKTIVTACCYDVRSVWGREKTFFIKPMCLPVLHVDPVEGYIVLLHFKLIVYLKLNILYLYI